MQKAQNEKGRGEVQKGRRHCILKVWVGRAALLQHKQLGVLLKPKVQGSQKVLLRFPQGVALPRWRRSV